MSNKSNERIVMNELFGIDPTLQILTKAHEIINAQNARKSLLQSQKASINSNNAGKKAALCQ